MKSARMIAVAVVSVVAACGGDDDGGGVNVLDGGSGTGDGSAAECLAPASLGSPTPTAPEGHYTVGDADDDPATPDVPDNFYLFADANQDATPDVFLIDLYLGGPFEDGFKAASVPITGPEADYWDCAACVSLGTDYGQDGRPTGSPYQAVGGTINLTSVSTTSIAGTLTNVTFQHVDVDTTNFTSTPSADGCMSSVTSVSFSAVPELVTNFTGDKHASRKSRLKARLVRTAAN